MCAQVQPDQGQYTRQHCTGPTRKYIFWVKCRSHPGAVLVLQGGRDPALRLGGPKDVYAMPYRHGAHPRASIFKHQPIGPLSGDLTKMHAKKRVFSSYMPDVDTTPVSLAYPLFVFTLHPPRLGEPCSNLSVAGSAMGSGTLRNSELLLRIRIHHASVK